MSLDLTPQHSWKMVMRHYRSGRGQYGIDLPGIDEVCQAILEAGLDATLFARTSHENLIISHRREYFIHENTLRISEYQGTVTFERFDTALKAYQVIEETPADDVRQTLAKCLPYMTPPANQ